MLRRGFAFAATAAALLLCGCASVPPGAGSNPADPFERVNRNVYAFNDAFDRAIAVPVARGYVVVFPKLVRACLANAFDNVGELGNAVNAVFQAEPFDLATDVGRFGINTTLGLLGCFDVARGMGLEIRRQDFGLTLGKWGIPDGPYLVLPFLGPRSLRDAVGEIPDYYTDPVSYVLPMHRHYYIYAGRFVVVRAKLLDASRLVEQAALDPYAFLRDAYLQRRRSRVYDGNPPPMQDEDDPDAPAPAGAPVAQGATPRNHP